MKRPWILVLAFVAVFVAGGAVGIAADLFAIGAVPSNRVTEKFQMSVGVAPTGKDLRPGWISQEREVVNVPSHYGRLITVHGGREAAVFWYQDEGGRIRNVVVEQADSIWYLLAQKTSSDLDVTARKK
jgi:hypothetical protein